MKKSDIWTRGSDAYNKQAEMVLSELADLYHSSTLEWAGSEDGEAAIGLYKNGKISTLFHLENPQDALALKKAIREKNLRGYILQSELDIINESLQFNKPTKTIIKRKGEIEALLAVMGW